jgi:DnaJ family protein C protein 19
MIYKLLVGLALVGLAYVWWRRQTMRPAPMRASEARKLLGVGEGAGADDIRAAHRRLIAKVHPDAGGSQGLATRVNAARDALLNELEQR